MYAKGIQNLTDFISLMFKYRASCFKNTKDLTYQNARQIQKHEQPNTLVTFPKPLNKTIKLIVDFGPPPSELNGLRT